MKSAVSLFVMYVVNLFLDLYSPRYDFLAYFRV